MSFPRSGVLVLGPNSIQSLVPSTLISQVESLLDSHRIQDAVDLADQQRRRLHAGAISIDEDEAEELRYVYQRIGFQCLSETLFEDAGAHLTQGDLDPRLLISYFPDLRGGLFSADEAVDVFAGVAERMPVEVSVDEIIRNYSPHLPPNTRSAPPTAELRRILGDAAREMLLAFLKRWRQSAGRGQGVGGPSNGETRFHHPASAAVDTALATLYARAEHTPALHALLHDPGCAVVPGEIESVLRETGQYGALVMVLKRVLEGKGLKASEEDREAAQEGLLGIWAKLIDDASWADPDIPDPTTDMLAFLRERRKSDPALVRKWALWLIARGSRGGEGQKGGKEMEGGLKLLMSDTFAPGRRKNTAARKGKTEAEDEKEELALLREITGADAGAGRRYLEWLVLGRGSASRELHTQLAMESLDQVLTSLADETVSKLWRAKASSYASSSTASPPVPSASPSPGAPPPSTPPSTPPPTRVSTSFLSYFATTTPDSVHKRTRLQTILFLASSALYDFHAVRRRLDEHHAQTKAAGVLRLEGAILDGKLGNHRAVLAALVHNLHDYTSAEAYCTLGGGSGSGSGVVPPKTAKAVVEGCGLEPHWAVAGATTTPGSVAKQKSAGEEVKRELLKILLEVYMSDEEASPGRAAHLLNSQGMNLDVLDVIQLVPPTWPVSTMSCFLSRTFRRTLHERHQGQIVKTISAGQNLEVKDRTWLVLREEGMIIEEAVDEDEDDGEGGAVLDEKRALVEKVGVHLAVVPGVPGEGGGGDGDGGGEEKRETSWVESEDSAEHLT